MVNRTPKGLTRPKEPESTEPWTSRQPTTLKDHKQPGKQSEGTS